MKLKMIIADDEHHVREGLKEIVAWDELGVDIIAVAADGQEAFELCRDLKPDILLTDIRMPMMDGLEAAFKLKEFHDKVRFIIISGAQEFNYVKTALSLHADGYILKPIKLQELQATVAQVVASIQAERKRDEHAMGLQRQLQENIPALRDKFLVDLVQGLYKSEREIADKLTLYKLPFKLGGAAVVAVFQIDEYEKAMERYTEEYKQLLSFSVTNILEEIVSRDFPGGVSFAMNENEFIVLFNQAALHDNRYLALCPEMIDSVNRYLNFSISAGIGNPVEKLVELYSSYNEASKAMEYRFFKGKNAMLPIGDFQTQGAGPDFSLVYEEQKQLFHFMKLGNREEVAAKTQLIFDAVLSGNAYTVGYVQSVCFDLINMASKTMYELGENIEKIVGDYYGMFGEVYNKREAAELQDMVLALFHKLTGHFAQKMNQKNGPLIHKIKDIISKRYMEDLSVAKLAEEVFLSPNYISLIFKQETGENITEYVTKVRMEAAKTLLKDNDLKIMEVAEMVGFENTTYFSTVFKKYTGIHPQKYRSLLHG